jgi:hypothetical protein
VKSIQSSVRVALPILAALATLTLVAFGALAAPTDQQDGGYAFPIQVTSVNVQLRESNPVQVALDVEGVVGNGCTRFQQVVQWREENTIVVRVLGRHTGAQVCTMIALLYHDTTLVDGPLPPGDYTVDVNGVTSPLHIDGPSAANEGVLDSAASLAAER